MPKFTCTTCGKVRNFPEAQAPAETPLFSRRTDDALPARRQPKKTLALIFIAIGLSMMAVFILFITLGRPQSGTASSSKSTGVRGSVRKDGSRVGGRVKAKP